MVAHKVALRQKRLEYDAMMGRAPHLSPGELKVRRGVSRPAPPAALADPLPPHTIVAAEGCADASARADAGPAMRGAQERLRAEGQRLETREREHSIHVARAPPPAPRGGHAAPHTRARVGSVRGQVSNALSDAGAALLLALLALANTDRLSVMRRGLYNRFLSLEVSSQALSLLLLTDVFVGRARTLSRPAVSSPGRPTGCVVCGGRQRAACLPARGARCAEQVPQRGGVGHLLEPAVRALLHGRAVRIDDPVRARLLPARVTQLTGHRAVADSSRLPAAGQDIRCDGARGDGRCVQVLGLQVWGNGHGGKAKESREKTKFIPGPLQVFTEDLAIHQHHPSSARGLVSVGSWMD